MNRKSEIAELVDEIQSEIVPEIWERIETEEECETCGVNRFELREETAKATVECFEEVSCIELGCDGRLSFDCVVVDTGGSIPIKIDDYVDVRIEDCDCSPSLPDVRREREADEITEYEVPVEQVVATKMHSHHTSYEPPRTMRVCNSCHQKIHNRDGFHDELEPDMSREDWEAQR